MPSRLYNDLTDFMNLQTQKDSYYQLAMGNARKTFVG